MTVVNFGQPVLTKCPFEHVPNYLLMIIFSALRVGQYGTSAVDSESLTVGVSECDYECLSRYVSLSRKQKR
jgi:hypothetical protein